MDIIPDDIARNPTPVLDPPEGCMEIAGYILCVGNKHWMTETGGVTDILEDRGVWPTAEEAEAAVERFCVD